MSDFLANLASRAVQPAADIQPRRHARFEEPASIGAAPETNAGEEHPEAQGLTARESIDAPFSPQLPAPSPVEGEGDRVNIAGDNPSLTPRPSVPVRQSWSRDEQHESRHGDRAELPASEPATPLAEDRRLTAETPAKVREAIHIVHRAPDDAPGEQAIPARGLLEPPRAAHWAQGVPQEIHHQSREITGPLEEELIDKEAPPYVRGAERPVERRDRAMARQAHDEATDDYKRARRDDEDNIPDRQIIAAPLVSRREEWRDTAADATGPAPTIQVTIGRIEVRAPAPAATQRPARTGPAVTTLEDYLRQRNRGRS